MCKMLNKTLSLENTNRIYNRSSLNTFLQNIGMGLYYACNQCPSIKATIK